jgi:hypothetical protein
MADRERSRGFQPLGGIGGRAAAATLRPLTDAAYPELERLISAALESERIQESLQRALASGGARQLIDDLFDSGLFDHFVDRLLASDGLWRIVDEVAASPSVTAAITQQTFGFADVIAAELRSRSRRADDRLERIVGRAVPARRRPGGGGEEAEQPPGPE